MEKFYFTFGSGQAHENCYHVIEAENRQVARIEMTYRFGKEWSMQYVSAEAAGVEEFDLREIT